MTTFSTERLKQLVSYAIQGAGFNKLVDLTNYLGIRVEDNMLYLNTTDGTNYMSVSDSCSAENFDITVNAELFSKLISKINSDTVDLEIVDNTLVVKGNGKYTLELIPDENGNMLSFPDKFPKSTTEIGTLGAMSLNSINTTIKASLSNIPGSAYNNYYFGDIVASTDKIMISTFNHKVFEEPYLVNSRFIDLVSFGLADVIISKSDDMLVAETEISENCFIDVCAPIQSDTSEFKIDGVKKFSEMETTSFCRFRKAQMLELLDRLSLFVTKFDDGAIVLHFTDSYVEVSSIANSGIERIEFTESKDAQDMTIKINIDRLRNQLKAYSSDIVDFYYGSDICVKLIDGDLTQVIALIK